MTGLTSPDRSGTSGASRGSDPRGAGGGEASPPQREQTLARVYATVTGATVVLIGIGGLLLGNTSLFGVLNIDRAEDAIHLLSGGALLGAGLLARKERVVRAVVGVIGVAYLAVGVLAFAAPEMFGLIPHGYETVLDNLIHLTLGVLGIAIGFFIPSRRLVGSTT
jgi:hypothetical protein